MKRLLSPGVVAVLGLLVGCQESQTAKPAEQKPMATPVEQEASPAAVAEIIIDNADPGFRGEGIWTSAVAGNDYKDEVVWAEQSTDATATATWTPDIKVAGMYEVFEWHGDDPNYDHASNAPFTIHYDGGSTTVPVDLRKNIGRWNTLGTYKFAAGTGGSVTLTNKADGNVIADAIKLVYKGK